MLLKKNKTKHRFVTLFVSMLILIGKFSGRGGGKPSYMELRKTSPFPTLPYQDATVTHTSADSHQCPAGKRTCCNLDLC